VIPPGQLRLLAELSFLRIFLAWEEFLEETFIRYMRGAKTGSGYGPRCFVNPTTLEHASQILTSPRQYVDWTTPSEAIKRAKLYFHQGEPYASALLGATEDLQDMNTIRNRIAHSSAHAKQQFRSLVLRKFGYNPAGMGPGRLLLHTIPPHGQQTFFEHHANVILTLSAMIVP